MKTKVLVVVAHPDDETIWMGGTLLLNKDKWDLTIISLCRRDDRDRAPKFKKVCKIYKAKSFMSNLEDDKLNDIKLEEVIKRIKKFSKKEYDIIFTHGSNGEYGHKRHKDVHKAVKKMLKDGIINCKSLFFFSYLKKGKFVYTNSNADKFIKLSRNNFNKKKQIIQDVYGFDANSFESVCCRDQESFKTKKLK